MSDTKQLDSSGLLRGKLSYCQRTYATPSLRHLNKDLLILFFYKGFILIAGRQAGKGAPSKFSPRQMDKGVFWSISRPGVTNFD